MSGLAHPDCGYPAPGHDDVSVQRAVRVEDVVRSFGEVRALDGVSLSFEPGIVYALLGPNGAGKTTLIRVLTTLLKPDSGRVEVEGIDVVADPRRVRSRIGLGGQYAAIDDFQSGRENVEMVGRLYNLSRREAAQRTTEVLERINLIEAADRQVRTYSGGMRRRLDLAASMVGRPSVLFLDEPTTGVDPRSRIELWELIRELVEGGTTLLLTTQYLEEADYLADRIGVIDEGQLIAEGTARQLKAKLGGDVIALHVGAADREAALRILTDIAGEPPSEHRGTLSIPAPDGAASLTATVRALDDAGLAPEDIALRKPTLDDVFLALTGRVAEIDSAPEPERRRIRKARR